MERRGGKNTTWNGSGAESLTGGESPLRGRVRGDTKNHDESATLADIPSSGVRGGEKKKQRMLE